MKLTEVKDTDMVVIEFPARMGFNEAHELIEIEAVKRSVIRKDSFRFFIPPFATIAEALQPKIVGTPSGEMDENYLVGYIAFDSEKKVKEEVK